MKSKNFLVKLVIYPFDVMVSLGETDKELKKSLNKYEDAEWDEDMICYGDGRAIITENNHSIIRLKKYPVTNEDYSYLQHEIFHIVTFIMDRIGVKFKLLTSDETYAYLIQFLTKEIYNKI